ncbi:MAG: glycosyltransferase family 4 protein [Prevotella sp.]|nr:glycosyltransferase family 4 protein [Prevotella sp.]
MRILFVIDKMQNYAGIERILTCKMNYISEQTAYNVFLTTYEQASQDLPFQLNGKISYQPIHIPMPLRNKMTFFSWLKAYFQARSQFKFQFGVLLNNIQPDIVICTVYSFQILDIILNTSHKKGIKTIMESHTKGETVTMAHKFKYNRHLHKLLSLWDYHIMKNLQYCSCVVTLTKQDVPFWQRYAQRIEVIPNMLTITPKMVSDYRTKRAISAGRYMSEKGFDRLLKSWRFIKKDFCDWQLYIFGNGDRIPYQEIVDQLQLGEVVHLMQATEDIAEEFSKSSIYVMSSRYEGFGLVLAEAMSCGLPCVSFNCPYGPREIITDGDDGFLAKEGDIEDLAKKLEQLMSDEELRKNMGAKAIHNITRYKQENIMAKWINLFNSI